MIVKKQIENFKQELHKEVDAIFKMPNLDDPDFNITMQDFNKKSEQFYKKYYTLCKNTNDILFENDMSIPLYHKERYREQKNDKNTLSYDTKVMPVLESINMLSCPGTYEFSDFSKMLSESIKFLFTVYCFLYSINLSKWIRKPSDITNLNEPAIQLKQLLKSIADDLVICFQSARVDPEVKLPLTMLYGSEVQDQINVKVAKHLASEEIAIQIAEKVLSGRSPFGKLSSKAILEGILEADKITNDKENELLQVAFRRLIKIMVDMFLSSLASHLVSSPLKPQVLTTETRMKLIDSKNYMMREIQREFDRIK